MPSPGAKRRARRANTMRQRGFQRSYAPLGGDKKAPPKETIFTFSLFSVKLIIKAPKRDKKISKIATIDKYYNI